jgi:hypothetical protein
MAIQKKGGPEFITPVKNQVYFYYDSTNKNAPAFRYVCEVYNSDTNVKLDEFKIAPRIGDGFCVLNLSKTLQGYIPGNLNIDEQSIHADQTYLNYDVRVGETFGNLEWGYSDYEFYVNQSSVFDSYTLLRSFDTGNTHTYTVGTQINIVQEDGGALKPMLNGLHTIVEIPNAWSVVIGIGFWQVGAGATISGATTYADNRKVIYRNLLNDSGNTAIRMAEYHEEFMDFSASTYANTEREFLTNVPNEFRLMDDATSFLNFYITGASEASIVVYQNSNGDKLSNNLSGVTSGMTNGVIQVAAGANANPTTVISGTTGLIKSDTEYYDVWIENGSSTKITETKRFKVRRDCKISEYEILFRDMKGSYLSFPFTLRSRTSYNVNKSEYKQYLGDLNTNTDRYGYESTDRGSKTYNIDVTKTLNLNTPFLTIEESKYFKELVWTGDAYIKFEGKFWPIIIQTNSVEEKERQNHRLIKYDLSVNFANNSNTNY